MQQTTPITHGLVVFAKNIPRMSQFYQRTLNLTVTESAGTHEVLNGSGIEMVIHGIPKSVADSITVDEPPKPRASSALKPAFVVDSLKAVQQAATDTGGSLRPIGKAWTIRGARVVDGCDPEGNVVQFKEIARNA